MAGQIINTAIEAPSSPFVHTQAILTVFSIPLVLAITFVFFGLYLVFFLFIDLPKMKNINLYIKTVGITPIVRISTYISAWALILTLLNSYSEPYSKELEKVAKWSVYNLESESFSYCKKNEKQRVSYIGSNIILISEKIGEKYVFKMEQCINKL